MSRDLVTVRAGARVSQVSDLFREHAFTSIPVVADNDVLLGVIFHLDLIRSTRLEGFLLDTGLMNPTAMARKDRDPQSLRADAIMSVDLPSVTPDMPASTIIGYLADGGSEAVPVLQGPRIVGIVTRTDLVSALARHMARDGL